MGRAGWVAGLTLMSAVVAGEGSAAESFESLPLEVLVMDHVGVPADTLEQSRHETSRIFEKLGISLVWVEDQMPKGPRYLIVKIVSKAPGRKNRNPGALGIAAASNTNRATVAWLFYERIDQERKRVGVDLSLLLGHVIAHEMGHLLLSHGAHTAAGLMKAGWDMPQAALASQRKLTFAPEQAVAIRARLRNVIDAATVANP